MAAPGCYSAVIDSSGQVCYGAVTFQNTPVNAREMLVQPDRLMYRVKESGRDGIEYGQY